MASVALRRRSMLIALGAIGLMAMPLLAGAAPLPSSTTTPTGFLRFCAEAQITIANIDTAKLVENGGQFQIANTAYRDESDFVFSKSAVSTSAKKILTTSYVQYEDGSSTAQKLIRCKMRTGESLNKGAWPSGAGYGTGRFVVEPSWGFGSAGNGLSTSPNTDGTCQQINQTTLTNVWGSLSSGQKASAAYNPDNSTIVTDTDTVVGVGPSWTPPVAAVTVSGGIAHIPSRALVATTSGNASVAPYFEGAHYCTLVAPDFLRRVILGQVAPS